MLNLFRSKIFWKLLILFFSLILLFVFLDFYLFQSSFFSILFVALLFSIFFSLVVTKYFDRSFSPLSQSIQSMIQGKWEVRIPVFGKDRFASLSREMNELSGVLVHLISEMKKESKQLRVILDSMSEGVMVLNDEGEIILTNFALAEMFSLENSPLGFTPLELIRNLDLQQLIEEIETKKSSIEREIEIQTNSPKQIRVYAAPLKDQEAVRGFVLVFHDITSLRNLENLRSEFVANVSHELKTPLTVIKGYTETLLQGAWKNEERSKKFLQVIHEHTNRLNDLLHDLLDLSKIESGRYEIKPEKIEIQSMVNELISTFLREIELKQIDFQFSTSIDSVSSDRLALRQILSNLLENAIKYSHSQGKITLQVESFSDFVQFSVEDDGPGISQEQVPRIFERFYRTDPSRSREQGGTGLGLSIVKHLVQLQGGEIWVETELGQGSKFIFTLPGSKNYNFVLARK